jgi:hypothetical protein
VISHRFALEEDREYSFSAPTDDPWYYDTVQRNGAASGKNWSLLVPGRVPGPAMLSVDVWGGLDYPDAGNDHRYRVSLNGVVLGERSFDGVSADSVRFALAAGQVFDGPNEVRIELLETGFARDILRVESIAISSQARLQASHAAQGFSAAALVTTPDTIRVASFETIEPAPECGDGCRQLRVVGLPDNDVLALHLSEDTVTELTDAIVVAETAGWTALVRHGDLMPGADSVDGNGDRLLVLSRSQAHQPELRPAAAAIDPLSGGSAELIVIAPFRYLDAMAPLLQARQAEGLSVRAVNVADLYQRYSAGVVDPMAIKRFLQQAQSRLGTRYVLLAGGDTFDYLDRLRLGSISDVPTMYGRTHAVVAHAPLDGYYADLNDDGSPELAIGRLPARTVAELQQMVAKILAPRPSGLGVLMAAERANPAEGADYASELDGALSLLPPAAQANAQRIYLDQYPSGSSGVNAARADLTAAVNGGVGLVGYFGHGSPTIWSREQLLQSAQIESLLQNTQAPVVSEFGCWGGYFVAPQYSSMSHGWLAHDAGASAYLGSSGLTEHDSDRRMAEVLLPALLQPGVRLGDAVRAAKAQLQANEPEYADIIRGLSLFGDPTMRMPQP